MALEVLVPGEGLAAVGTENHVGGWPVQEEGRVEEFVCGCYHNNQRQKQRDGVVEAMLVLRGYGRHVSRV